ncbi:MAG: hypothetical protein LBQ54_05665 [Planctomycetaceae bacterium]|jgi:hypothetical protein|nr:hypothetical protein [Planctomycetaceae bacterium]
MKAVKIMVGCGVMLFALIVITMQKHREREDDRWNDAAQKNMKEVIDHAVNGTPLPWEKGDFCKQEITKMTESLRKAAEETKLQETWTVKKDILLKALEKQEFTPELLTEMREDGFRLMPLDALYKNLRDFIDAIPDDIETVKEKLSDQQREDLAESFVESFRSLLAIKTAIEGKNINSEHKALADAYNNFLLATPVVVKGDKEGTIRNDW